MSVGVPSERLLRTSSEAWRLLRGVVALYKPAGVTMAGLKKNLKARIVSDLNEMDRNDKWEALREKWGFDPQEAGHGLPRALLRPGGASAAGQGESGAATEETARRHLLDYSLHPSLLGEGFREDDIRVSIASPLTYRMSGLVLASVNLTRCRASLSSRKRPLPFFCALFTCDFQARQVPVVERLSQHLPLGGGAGQVDGHRLCGREDAGEVRQPPPVAAQAGQGDGSHRQLASEAGLQLV